jgi:hypothetical protein
MRGQQQYEEWRWELLREQSQPCREYKPSEGERRAQAMRQRLIEEALFVEDMTA